MKHRRILNFVYEYTPNWQKKRGSTTGKMGSPIRMKMEHAKNWLPVAADDGKHEEGLRTTAGQSIVILKL